MPYKTGQIVLARGVSEDDTVVAQLVSFTKDCVIWDRVVKQQNYLWLLYGDEDSAAQATTTLQSAQCQSLNGHSFEALFLGPPDKVLEEEDEQRLCARMIQLLSEQDSSAIANLGLPPRAPTPPQEWSGRIFLEPHSEVFNEAFRIRRFEVKPGCMPSPGRLDEILNAVLPPHVKPQIHELVVRPGRAPQAYNPITSWNLDLCFKNPRDLKAFKDSDLHGFWQSFQGMTRDAGLNGEPSDPAELDRVLPWKINRQRTPSPPFRKNIRGSLHPATPQVPACTWRSPPFPSSVDLRGQQVLAGVAVARFHHKNLTDVVVRPASHSGRGDSLVMEFTFSNVNSYREFKDQRRDIAEWVVKDFAQKGGHL